MGESMRYQGLRSSTVSRLAIVVAAFAAPIGLTEPAAAQQVTADSEREFAIPAGPLSQALQAYSTTTGIQLVYSSDLVAGASSPGVRGRMTRADALAQLLAGTGLTANLSGNSATIRRIGTGAGERVLGAVRVEGAQGGGYFGRAGQAAGVNGINGSRDITATEGTKSFTSGALTIGSKVPQAMKDVPQSLSVLTSERLEQQNVTDFTTAMKQLPGITLVQGPTNLENTFYSRGFVVSSVQIDGGAPLNSGYGLYTQIDMAEFDHVELLRGAAGLFNGYGDPSGTVNLVRKKPLDHSQIIVEGQAGSWRNYRAMIDATSPLALDGKLRGRLVMTYQDNHHFYDFAKDNKTLIYGIAELDVTPTTLASAGISYSRQNSVPWQGGLPRYQNGDDIGLPRSTAFVFPWNRWNFETTEIFGRLEQRIGNEWTAALNVTHRDQDSTLKLGYNCCFVNPISKRGPQMTGNYGVTASQQLAAEAVLSGAFNLFGQRQEITLGATHSIGDGDGQTIYASLISGTKAAPYQPYPGGPTYYPGSPYGSRPPIDVFDFDPNDPIYTEPRNPLKRQRFLKNRQTISGAYMNLRLTAFDRLHLTTGFRWSRYESNLATEIYCITTTGACAGKQIGDVQSSSSRKWNDTDISWPPPVNLSFDVTKSLTAYAGYTDIYQSQATLLTSDLKPIAPITGSNWEAGLKWAPHDGRLNVSLAAYHIKQRGFATLDGTFDPDTGDFVASNGQHFPNGGAIDDTHSCCWKADPNQIFKSQGIDLEATGEVRPGWQVSASYNYNDNKQVGETFGPNAGKPIVSIQPKHLYRLWTSYDFKAAGHTGALAGLTLSGGVNGQSSAFRSGSVCVHLKGDPNPVTGFQDECQSDGPPDLIDFAFKVPSYAVFSGRIDYVFSNKWSLAINLENILDKTYYQTVGSDPRGGHWYGAPRSFTATLRAKW
jgi:outer membrane receptor for ferric coprogen and ferric-rhodotorulic acid